MILNPFKDKEFNRLLIKLAFPITLQHMIIFSLGMIDTIMIGQLGKSEIAGVSIGNQFHFLLLLLLFGISSGIAVFTSQYYGKSDVKNIRRMLGVGLATSFASSIIFFIAAFFFPEKIMDIYTKDILVKNFGITYLKITSISYFFTSITIIFSVILKSTYQVLMPLSISFFSLISDAFLNYLLIFGNFGFPRLGVEGAAIATLISRICGVILFLFLIYRKENILAAKFSELTDISTELLKKIIKTSLPVVINEFGWGSGVAALSVIYSRMGTDSIAAYSMSEQAMNILMIFIFGTSLSCSTIIGNNIGSKDYKKAVKNSDKFFSIAVIGGLSGGLMSILLSSYIPLFFNVSKTIQNSSKQILIVFGFFLLFKSINFHLIVGVLRGGGDTKYGMIIDIMSLWGIGIPLAAIGAFYFNLGIETVYILASTEELFKFALAFPRYKSRKWVNDLVN